VRENVIENRIDHEEGEPRERQGAVADYIASVFAENMEMHGTIVARERQIA